MTIKYPKYVKRANQWVITTLDKNVKTGEIKQTEEWYSTEAVAVAEFKKKLDNLTDIAN